MELISQASQTDTISYISSGRLGDFIYQLSVVNETFITTGKKGIVYICASPEPFAYSLEKTYNDTKDYIRALPYIADYKIHNGESIDINLSTWRSSNLLFRTHWHNIFKQAYSIEWGIRPWLFSKNNPNTEGKILISCSTVEGRFPTAINFNKLFESFGIHKMLFITQTINEYNHFCSRTKSKLNIYTPESICDYISAIHSCECFIGNLSSPLTYAYGLHKKSITMLNLNRGDNTHVLGLESILPNNEFMITFG
jgi:hypothetical protein